MSQESSVCLQRALETVERLSHDDQTLLVEIVRKRLIEQRREEMAGEVAEARAAYRDGKVRRGAVANLLEELAE